VVQTTATQPTAGRPGSGDRWRPDSAWAKAHEHARLRQKDGEHSFASGTKNPRRGAAAGGDRKGAAWTHHFHGRATTRRRSHRVRGGLEERPILGGIKTHMGYNQEAYDAECATLATALEAASRRRSRSGSRSSPMHRGPSNAWPRRSWAPARRCAPGEEAHRGAEECQAGHHY